MVNDDTKSLLETWSQQALAASHHRTPSCSERHFCKFEQTWYARLRLRLLPSYVNPTSQVAVQEKIPRQNWSGKLSAGQPTSDLNPVGLDSAQSARPPKTSNFVNDHIEVHPVIWIPPVATREWSLGSKIESHQNGSLNFLKYQVLQYHVKWISRPRKLMVQKY